MSLVELLEGDRQHRFDAGVDRNLLDQALESGKALSFSCRRGDCGQCVGQLEAGRVAPLNPSQPWLADDQVYLCNATALTDVRIRLPHCEELAQVRSMRSPAKIHQLNRLGEEVVELVLRLPPITDFRFLPGQFIRLTNRDRITRSYSLAAPGDATRQLRLHVRRVNNGAFSDYLFGRAVPGDLLHVEGPMGRFFLRKAQTASLTLFLATGTGIAPIFAMLAALDDAARARLGGIDLYWGNRHAADEYLADALTLLCSRLGIGYWPLRSREASSGARHVQDLMVERHPDLRDAEVFASGNAAMIAEARSRCLERGLDASRFHSDPFTDS